MRPVRLLAPAEADDHAVRGACTGFTLTTPSRDPGRYGDSSRLATTPSSPAWLEAIEPSLRLLRVARRPGRAGSAWPCAPARACRFSSGSLVQRLALPEEDVEGDELGRDLSRELADPALGGMESQLHRGRSRGAPFFAITISPSSAESWAGAAPSLLELREVPQAAGRPFRDQSRKLAADSSRGCRGSRPTSARTASRRSAARRRARPPCGGNGACAAARRRQRYRRGEFRAGVKVTDSARRNACSRW